MKKFGMFAICSLFLFTGCGEKKEEKAWYLDFDASSFKWEKSITGAISAVGTIKNTSSKKCDAIEIKLTYKKDGVENHTTCLKWPELDVGATFTAECMYTGNSVDTIMQYDIDVDSVKCRDDEL